MTINCVRLLVGGALNQLKMLRYVTLDRLTAGPAPLHLYGLTELYEC